MELKVEYFTVLTTEGRAGGQKNSKDPMGRHKEITNDRRAASCMRDESAGSKEINGDSKV